MTAPQPKPGFARVPARRLQTHQREAMARALLEAPTVLENLYLGWLLGTCHEDLYVAELLAEDMEEIDLPEGPRRPRYARR